MVRFDVAKVYGSYVGESETTLNECLRLAEAVSPCVLWMDEIEKALAGTSGGRTGDGGVGTRVFGQLLTWMNEKKSEVFLVATANNLDSIIANSPELLRRGRHDEIFFIDYPGEKARKKIFEIHLGNLAFDSETGQPMTQFVDLDSFDTEHLARLTEQWTGAEIEAVINEANEGAFLIGEDYPLTQDIITELISETTCDYERLEDREQKSISAMRAKAQKIGKRASSQD